MLAGSILFVLFGLWMSLDAAQFVSPRFSNEYFIRVSGIVAVGFFGICGGFLFKKQFDRRAGLIIDDEGITDNSGGTSIGLIRWKDIRGVRTEQIHSQKFLMIEVQNPEDYIAKARNGLMKNAMKVNWKMYGSPLSISANSLQYNFKELEQLVFAEMEKRKSTPAGN